MCASLKEQLVGFTGIARLMCFLHIVCSGNYSHPRKHTSKNLTIYTSVLHKSTTFTQLFESQSRSRLFMLQKINLCTFFVIDTMASQRIINLKPRSKLFEVFHVVDLVKCSTSWLIFIMVCQHILSARNYSLLSWNANKKQHHKQHHSKL